MYTPLDFQVAIERNRNERARAMTERLIHKTMNRESASIGQHRRQLLLLVGILLSMLITACQPITAPTDGTLLVVGQDDPTLDVGAVQAAVDQGGTVQLEGIFDFGDDGRVTINNDVVLVGMGRVEKQAEGATAGSADLPATKILGGDIPLFNADKQISVTIQDIWFDGPQSAAIALTAAAGETKISGNRITNVREGLHPATDRPTAGGIILANQVRYAGGEGYAYEPMPPEFDPAQDITFGGEVLVTNNYIDLDPEGIFHYDYLRAVGIESTQTTAQTTITNNIVRNSSHAGILVTDNFARHVISNNTVRIHDYPDGKQVLFPTGSSFGAEGIVIVEVFFAATEASASLISNNRIYTGGDAHAEQTGGEGPAALGLMINGPHIVEGNHVTMDGGYAAALLWTRPQAYFDDRFPGFIPPSSAADSLLTRNHFVGEALYLYTAKGRRDIPFDSQGPGSSNRASENTLMLAADDVANFQTTNSDGCAVYLSADMEQNQVIVDEDVADLICDSSNENQIVLAPNTVAVAPTGLYPEDVETVQAAVDANPGSTLILQAGVFNFGDESTGRGSVVLPHDITVVGDGRDAAGNPITQIYGGNQPFRSLAGTSIGVHELWFDEAKFVAIRLNGIAGTTRVVGNKITNLIDLPVSPVQFDFAGVAFAIRIEEGRGRLEIEDNDIDVDPQQRFPEFTIGVGINTRRLHAETVIRNNHTRNTSHAGILVLDNFAANYITNNVVETGDVPGPSTSTFGAEGIVAVAQLHPTSAQGTAYIHNNHVVAGAAIAREGTPEILGGSGPLALGIMLSGPHVVTNNHVVMDNGYAAVLIWTNRKGIGDITNSLIAHNRFEGTAQYLWSAAGTRNQPPLNRALQNSFIVGDGSNLANFTAQSGCHVFLPTVEAEDNLVVTNTDVDVTLCEAGGVAVRAN